MNNNSHVWIRLLLPLLLLSLFTGKSLYAQSNPIIDSLMSELPHKTDSAKVFLLVDISIEMSYINLVEAKKYSEEAVELAREINLSIGLGRAQEILGHCYHLLDDYEKAESLYQAALNIFIEHKHRKYESNTYSRLAQIYSQRGAFKESIEYYNRALEISRTLEKDVYIGTIIFGLASSYTKLGEYERAFDLLEESKPLISYEPHLIYYYAILGDLHCTTGAIEDGLIAFFEAAELCKKHNDQMRLAYVYEQIAKTYFDLGAYEKAAEYYFKIIEINRNVELPTLELVSRQGLGTLYKIWNDLDKSIAYLEKAEELALASQLNNHIAEIQLHLGEAFLEKRQFSKAENTVHNALSLAREIQSPPLVIKSCLQLCDIYQEAKNYEAAMLMLSQLESFISEENKNNLAHFYLSVFCKKGEIYFDKKEYEKSISILNQGLGRNLKFINKKEQSDYFKILSQAYTKIGDFETSLNFYQQHASLKDSIQQAANNKEINAIRVVYETREKEMEIEKLQQEKAMQSLLLDHQKSELSRKQSYLLLLFFLLLILGLSSYLFFNRFKWRKRTEKLQLMNSKMTLEKEHLKTRQQLEIAKLRAHLFTNISHEFRTPLTLILSPLESMINGDVKVQAKLLKMMHTNANKLLELVNQTLDLAKLESGNISLKRERCNVDLLIRNVFRNFLHIAEKRNIQIKIENESAYQLIDIDKVKMERVISNLLSNALRCSPPDSELLIVLQDSNTGLRISMTDQGEGIPVEHQARIFDRYYQVDKYSQRGTGIGLALVKEIVALHEGEISVQSEVGQGTTFTIFLPFDKNQVYKESLPSAKIDPETTELKNINTEQARNHKILLVEDNKEVMEYLTSVLSELGNVETAVNGKEALKMTRHFNPDLIICDIMMPVMDGMAFAKAVRKDLQISHIPIILLTAKASMNSKLEGLKIGVDDYLIKPFNRRELIIRSRNLILQRRRLKQLFRADKKIAVEEMAVNKLDQEFLEKALSVVRDHLDDSEFNVERFTRLIGMSRTNLYTKLKALTGKNILEFIRTLRIQKAVELIRTNSGNMNDIAYSVGYNNRQSFIKSFKLEMGKTPSEFKKSLKEDTKTKH